MAEKDGAEKIQSALSSEMVAVGGGGERGDRSRGRHKTWKSTTKIIKRKQRSTRYEIRGPPGNEERTIYFCLKNISWIGIAPSESRESDQAQPCHTSSRLAVPLNNPPSTLPVPSVRPSGAACGLRPHDDARAGMVRDPQKTANAKWRASDEEDEKSGVVDPTVGT